MACRAACAHTMHDYDYNLKLQRHECLVHGAVQSGYTTACIDLSVAAEESDIGLMPPLTMQCAVQFTNCSFHHSSHSTDWWLEYNAVRCCTSEQAHGGNDLQDISSHSWALLHKLGQDEAGSKARHDDPDDGNEHCRARLPAQGTEGQAPRTQHIPPQPV